MLKSSTFGPEQLWVFFVIVQAFNSFFDIQLLPNMSSNFKSYLRRFIGFFVWLAFEKLWIEIHSFNLYRPFWIILSIQCIEEGCCCRLYCCVYCCFCFWLQNQTPFKPIKSEYYARSGKLLKTAQYKAFKEFNGELKVHKMLLSDPLISGSYTWMLFDNYRSSELPDALFNKEAIVSLWARIIYTFVVAYFA